MHKSVLGSSRTGKSRLRRSPCALFIAGFAGIFVSGNLSSLAQQPAATIAELRFRQHVIDAHPPAQPYYKMAGDVNGDGQIDIVVAGRTGPLVMYSGTGMEKSVLADGGYNGGVNGELIDLDADGDLDIVMGSVVWFRNPRIGGGSEWVVHRIDNRNIHDIEVADLDGDGRPDVVARDQSAFGKSGNEFLLYYQTGAADWRKERIGCPHGEGLKLADLDGDHDPDIAIGGLWFENEAGSWREHAYAPQMAELDNKIEAGDVNGDGLTDLVVTPAELKQERGRICWYEAPHEDKRGAWIEHIVADPVECVIHGLALADFNQDGRLDIAWAEMHQGDDPDEVCVLFNGGPGRPWSRTVLSETGSHDIVAADLDGDGDPDLFGANHAQVYPLEWWENLHVRPNEK